MKQPSEHPSNSSFQTLPLVATAFALSTLVIACERVDSPLSTRGANGNGGTSQAAVSAAPPPRAAERLPAPIPPPEALTDTMITGRIQTALLSDPGMKGADVSVQTNKGVVTLVGTVQTHEQTGIASAHAQRQDGVVRVDSELSLTAQ
jgi:hypothetical protein